MRRALAGALAAALLVAAPTAAAQLFADDIAREQAGKNAQALQTLSTLVQNLRKQLGEVAQKQQAQTQRMRELVGQMEEMAAAAADQNALGELRGELTKAETERAGIAEEMRNLAGQFSEVQANIAEMGEYIALPEESTMYDAAVDHYQRKNYDSAAAGFRRMLRRYSSGKFAASARYWLSQIYIAQQQYDKAAEAAREVIQLHADSQRAPGAMLALARALQEMGRKAESDDTLSALIAKHPATLAADQARQLLSP